MGGNIQSILLCKRRPVCSSTGRTPLWNVAQLGERRVCSGGRGFEPRRFDLSGLRDLQPRHSRQNERHPCEGMSFCLLLNALKNK